jgi:SAM-dependent methyltransferase
MSQSGPSINTRAADQSPDSSAPSSCSVVIVILFTTLYREGGREMQAAAQHLAAQKRRQFPDADICLRRIESKAEFRQALCAATQARPELAVPPLIRELHFIGHSGLYGPMFGTRQHPEQMSRYEWNHFSIPFAPGAEAYFHCCRSGRWFAPYFSRRYGVPAYGYTSYTTFSRSPDRYVPVDAAAESGPVYVVSCPGYKAMGLRGVLRKRLLGGQTLPLIRYEPIETAETGEAGDGTYNAVAELYDAVFEDFRVRHDEWRWLTQQLADIGDHSELLDIGCGNGALLLALGPLLRHGTGVDVAARMIEIAQRRAAGEANLDFRQIDGPLLPFADGSMDVVVSMLSWRYLDWDPIGAEIRRVLRPGGRLLIVDMVVAPFSLRAVPRVGLDRVRTVWRGMARSDFRRSLKRMVEDPRWTTMLKHNPMRAEHEMRWYLPSRFTGGQFTTLNRGPRTEILAFRWDKPETEERH